MSGSPSSSVEPESCAFALQPRSGDQVLRTIKRHGNAEPYRPRFAGESRAGSRGRRDLLSPAHRSIGFSCASLPFDELGMLLAPSQRHDALLAVAFALR
jgi:hypothetical protein